MGYENAVNSQLNDLPSHVNEINNTNKIDNLIDKLTTVMLSAQEMAVPLVVPTPYAVCITQEIRSKIQQRNATRRYAQRNPRFTTVINNSVNAQARTIRNDINQIVNMNFNHKLSTLEQDNSRRSLWQMSRFLKRRRNQIPPFQVNNETLLTPEQKSDALAEVFSKNHLNAFEGNDITHTNHVNQRVQNYINNCVINDENVDNVTTTEVINIIKRLKTSKAPGLDKVHNTLLKRLPQKAIVLLTMIINACITLSYFPQQWKVAKVIAIKKPNNPSDQPTSYRPISLLSALSKVLERAILTRISRHLQDKHVIPAQQHGFQQHKSTVTQLQKVTKHIKTQLGNRTSTGVVLLDVEKAYDRVWHQGLVYKLIETETPRYLVKFVYAYLKGRSFHVTVNGGRSATHRMTYGLPQGAVLSPTLFNVYTYDIPNIENCHLALFADDTALYASHRRATKITKDLESGVKKIYKYYRKWKMKLNERKTKVKFFTKRLTRCLPRRKFKINNHEIEWDRKPVRYLGLQLDKQLTYKNHTEYAIKKSYAALGLLYSLFNRKSPLKVNTKILLYKTTIRQIATYAAPIISTAAKTHVKKLQIMQNKILKMILGVHWRTATDEIHNITGVERIRDYLRKLSDNFEVNYLDD